MRREKKEIQKLLLGRAVQDTDGKLVTPEPGTIFFTQGVQNGAGAVRLLGISGRKRRYAAEGSPEEILAEAVEKMLDLGRAVRLREQPGTAACLLRYLLTRPVLLVFRAGGDGCELTAWTGRGLLARAFQYRAIHAFERLLGDRLQPGSPAQRKRKERRSEPEGSAEEAPEDTGQENGEAPDEEDSEA